MFGFKKKSKKDSLVVKDLLNDLERAASAKQRVEENWKKDIDRPIRVNDQTFFQGSAPMNFTTFASTIGFPSSSSFYVPEYSSIDDEYPVFNQTGMFYSRPATLPESFNTSRAVVLPGRETRQQPVKATSKKEVPNKLSQMVIQKDRPRRRIDLSDD